MNHQNLLMFTLMIPDNKQLITYYIQTCLGNIPNAYQIQNFVADV